jgi:hypothetical protein
VVKRAQSTLDRIRNEPGECEVVISTNKMNVKVIIYLVLGYSEYYLKVTRKILIVPSHKRRTHTISQSSLVDM